jgi:hypothetical protein
MRSAVLCCLLTPLPALATDILFTPVPDRVAVADVVVVGTVTEVSAEPVEETRAGTDRKVWCRIATVKVDQPLLGAAELSKVWVKFARAADQPKDPGVIFSPYPGLDKGDEAILFLRKQPGTDYYVIDGHFGAVKNDPAARDGSSGFPKVLEETKPLCKLMADPAKALASDEPADRMHIARMLVTRYRSYPGGDIRKVKEEPIPAAESTLILRSLVPMAKVNPESFRDAMYRLGLKPEDGFDGEKLLGKDGIEQARKWIEDSAAKYRIKKWVVEK